MNTEFDKIEELLESSLADYEVQPSPKVWNKIASGLFFKSGLFYTISIGIIVLIGLGAYQYLNITEKSNPNLSINQNKLSNSNTNNLLSSVSDKEVSPIVTQNPETNKTVENSSINKNTLTKKPKKQINTIKKQKITNHNATNTTYKNISQINQIKLATHLQEQSLEKPIQINDLVISNLPLRTSFSLYLPRTSFKFRNRSGTILPNHYISNKSSIKIGGFISPEFIFKKNKETKRAINFDFLGTYGSTFFVQSGLGISFTEDQGNYHINYSQNDSIGFYEKVNSFTIGADGIPIFNTSTEAVYDTIAYETEEEVTNTFTYLRLPFYMGYSVHKYRRINIDLKAGIVYSMMINSNTPTSSYTNTRAVEISIKDNSLARVRSFKQFSLALSFSYLLSEKTHISFEPQYNYYTQSIYSNYSQQPWSLGLRFGLTYKLK